MDVGSWSFLVWYFVIVGGLAVTWLPAGALNARVGIMIGYSEKGENAEGCMKYGWLGVSVMLITGVLLLGIVLTKGAWRLLRKIAGAI